MLHLTELTRSSWILRSAENAETAISLQRGACFWSCIVIKKASNSRKFMKTEHPASTGCKFFIFKNFNENRESARSTVNTISKSMPQCYQTKLNFNAVKTKLSLKMEMCVSSRRGAGSAAIRLGSGLSYRAETLLLFSRFRDRFAAWKLQPLPSDIAVFRKLQDLLDLDDLMAAPKAL